MPRTKYPFCILPFWDRSLKKKSCACDARARTALIDASSKKECVVALFVGLYI